MSDVEQPTNQPRVWKVGALAELTGLTVRALHHYDRIGLLKASHRTPTGHRLYTGEDVARLYRICLLRRLGFSLPRIEEVLDDPQWQLRDAVTCHLDDTRRRVALATSLQSRLSKMASSLARFSDPSTEELFATIEEMTMLDSNVRSTTASLVYDDIAAAHDISYEYSG
ncbi:MerR family transcriptional regulator [Mycobacterium heidelbergense]|uniref:MerR family transcriptional regulator n=1 Tax=Mycobacterium heidelbergense TaxID=53376 RepID=UPI003CF374A5